MATTVKVKKALRLIAGTRAKGSFALVPLPKLLKLLPWAAAVNTAHLPIPAAFIISGLTARI